MPPEGDKAGLFGRIGAISDAITDAFYDPAPASAPPSTATSSAPVQPAAAVSSAHPVAQTAYNPKTAAQVQSELSSMEPVAYAAYVKLDSRMKSAIPEDARRLEAVLVALEVQGFSKEQVLASFTEYASKIEGYLRDFNSSLAERKGQELSGIAGEIQTLEAAEADLERQIAELTASKNTRQQERESKLAAKTATEQRFVQIGATVHDITSAKLGEITAEKARLSPQPTTENGQ